ncbi:MAG: CapA family protein [Desulfotomaculum sp.]|nr:CapA family protein [Desulfotomaculum sp.]
MSYLMSFLILFTAVLPPAGEQALDVLPHNTIILVSAVGDNTIGYDIDFGYNGSFNQVVDTNGLDYPFKNVAGIFKNDHLTIANLETALTNSTTRAKKKFKFAGKPAYRDVLAAGGIDAVNLANNHTMDYLEQGYNDTLANLKAAGIGCFGNGIKLVKNINGIKVGMLGYKGWTDSRWIRDKIAGDIAELKKQAQVVIISFHWGVERSNYPSNVQKELGRFAVDSGADLVLGHHPHVIQGIEKYKGKIIVYSLGNFVFGGNKNPGDKDTFIYQQEFIISPAGNAENGEIIIIPASVSSVKGRNNYQPVVLKGTEAERVLNRIINYSKDLEYGFNKAAR